MIEGDKKAFLDCLKKISYIQFKMNKWEQFSHTICGAAMTAFPLRMDLNISVECSDHFAIRRFETGVIECTASNELLFIQAKQGK